jgi:uncharacterized protein YcfL
MLIGLRCAVRTLARLLGVILVAALALAFGGTASTDIFGSAGWPFLGSVPDAALFTGYPIPGSDEPLETTNPTIESADRFVLLDRPTRVPVTCTDLQEHTFPDGRLEVAVRVKNRERRCIQVQINCVFKDVQGFSTGDETPFRKLILAGESTEAIKFTSINNLARKYTIRVRLAR